MYEISKKPDRMYDVEMDIKQDGGPGSGRHAEGGSKQEVHPDAMGYSRRIGIIDKNNIVHTTEKATGFAKDYIAKEKTGDESGNFMNKYEKVGKGPEPFNKADVFKNKKTDEHFMVNKEPTQEGKFGQKPHYVSLANKP